MSDIPVSKAEAGLVRLVTAEQISKRLKKIEKPKSRVNSDLPKNLVQLHYRELSAPLAEIFNSSFLNHSWPDIWKT